MYKDSDIDVFIITYNRKEFLPLAIKSILEQSIRISNLTIIDNGSIDGTADYLRKLNNAKIKIIINKENISFNVFPQIKELVSKKLVLIFHDDDILHYNYLKIALSFFNKYDKVSAVLSLMEGSSQPVSTNWKIKNEKIHTYCNNHIDLATLYYKNISIPFCSIIYRTEDFLKSEMDVSRYGKIFDRPFVLSVVENNGAVLLNNNFVRVRIHPSQDSKSLVTGPFLNEILNLNKLYFTLMSDNFNKSSGRIFLKMNYFNLIRDYKWIKSKEQNISKIQFCKLAISNSSASPKSIFLGYLIYPYIQINRIIKKIFI
jgi:glycosyltransferase involved in cell wall biosynthesis